MTNEPKTARSSGGVFAVSCHAPAAEAEPRQAAGGCERSDIVTRLRDRAYSSKAIDRLCEEAADVIEQLRARWDIAEKRAIRLGQELSEIHQRCRTREPAD